ncbi:DNA primase [Streptomyces sp. NPDC046727]|uniref:DNA primase n=1 Tax=Streptomyces sp. NPDC046727 TaxID=3155373 RepID=UPI0033D64983
MNRTALGLAIGAGYLLGRTKKMKMALTVGSLVAGKKLNLGPRALADQVNRQLRDNPQFKEIGDQLREDLRGVGKAATGAMVERQMSTLADRLHGRTAELRDQLSGALPAGSEEEPDEREEPDEQERQEQEEPESRDEAPREKTGQKAPEKRAPARKASKTGKKAPAGKSAADKAGGTRRAAKKTASAGGGRGAASRQSKGGDDR